MVVFGAKRIVGGVGVVVVQTGKPVAGDDAETKGRVSVHVGLGLGLRLLAVVRIMLVVVVLGVPRAAAVGRWCRATGGGGVTAVLVVLGEIVG